LDSDNECFHVCVPFLRFVPTPPPTSLFNRQNP
jgi:hypothetical protein